MREIQTIDANMLQINNETLLGWIVWCSDGNGIQKFNSKHHDWIDVPRIGIQYLYRIYDRYIEQVSGVDYYCPYQLMNVVDINPWIKFGLMINLETLDEIFNEVKDYSLEKFNEI